MSATGTEASAVGPVNERAHLERIAIGKLTSGAWRVLTAQHVVGRAWKA